MISITDKKRCVGCGSCISACRKKAICFIEDEQGFVYPIVNTSLCVECGMCESVCPIEYTRTQNDFHEKPLCYAAWNINNDERKSSSSGGVFTLLAKDFLDENGMVCGATWSNDLRVQHKLVSTIGQLSGMRKAKYIQSDTSGVFERIKQQLDSGKNILFSGTPCQVAGLKSFLKQDYDNLLTVEVICHGVVSQKVFSRYIESLENHLESKVMCFDFRDKTNGWMNYNVLADLMNHKSYIKSHNKDEYMLGYLWYNLFFRPACTNCKFKVFPRRADITLGDYWGADEKLFGRENCDKGISVVLLNSSKGHRMFDSISKNIVKKEIDLDKVISGNPSLVKSSNVGKYSSYFFKHYTEKDFIDLIHKIEHKSLWDRKDLTLKDRAFLLKSRLKGR